MKWLLQIGCVSNFLIKSSHYIVTLIENIRVDNDVRYIDIERYNNNVDVLVLSENVKSKSKNLFEKFKSQALDDTSGSFNFVKYYYQKIINFIRWIFYCDSHNGIYDNKRVLDTLDLLVCVLDKTFFENAQFLKIYSKLYDVDEKTPGNGYRSLNMTLGLIMIHINDCVTEIYQCKSNVCNLKSLLKLGVYTKVVIQLKASVHYLKQFTLYFSPNVEKSESKICLQNETIHINQIMKEIEVISQEKYFGDSIGFQYHPTIINIVRIITFGMAVTAKSFLMKAKHEPSNSVVKWITIFTSFVCARNYRELASNRITTATREGRLDFLLQFWNLYELGVITYTFSCLIIQPKVDKVFEIWYNKISVKTRLISRVLRKGQDRNNVETGHDLSNGLIFHCHGGGFISQSSLSHKVYLCEWSNKVGVPIFSVDYSLAIEKEFPNQIFEVVAAYEWALENKEKLGWNGKILLAVGDSAGANIIFGSIILLILQKKRIPDAIFSHYGVFNINWTPSPSSIFLVHSVYRGSQPFSGYRPKKFCIKFHGSS
ncbi:hypothetical protein A3Q56_02817 [Intoshia linei]|uniref:Hormone-sensitive lipase n=1 Tax=Intoshia linei TaxID=1819745 RepID=A0A177B711_9BILA|nr:hypothetical protein A3Q56_02817 [Intoshia linei]